MNKYTGQAWDGPVTDHACDDCGATTSIMQLTEVRANKVVARLNQYLCCNCSNQRLRLWQERRKAQLAAEPRCEVDGCKARGTMYGGDDHVLLCGRHFNRVKRGFDAASARSGMPWLHCPTPRDYVLKLAVQTA